MATLQKRIIIVGAGVSGLTAAHELLKRGYWVDIYEARELPGGKARSLAVKQAEYPTANTKKPLPSEHGFRFFPGFYQHLDDTMEDIPYKDRTVLSNLQCIKNFNLMRRGKNLVQTKTCLPVGPLQFIKRVKLWTSKKHLGLSLKELFAFNLRMLRLCTSCDKRFEEQYERISWWEFLKAEKYSADYKQFFANGMRILVAADPLRASAKTIGRINEQLILDSIKGRADRLLKAPTNQAWIFPWISLLLKNDRFRIFLNSPVKEVRFDKISNTITALDFAGQIEDKSSCQVTQCVDNQEIKTTPVNLNEAFENADEYLCAVPVEIAGDIISDDTKKHCPQLDKLDELEHHTQWMNGVIFYLKGAIKPIDGHSVILDSPFALSCVMQGQYWSDYPLEDYGQGNLTSICSVVVSNWIDVDEHSRVKNLPNKGKGYIYNKNAHDTYASGLNSKGQEKLFEEIWEDIKRSFQINGKPLLADENLEHTTMDPAVSRVGAAVYNFEPLLVNRANCANLRPTNTTSINNLFIAGDYTNTTTDLATMEGACESAKRAVNAILEKHGQSNLCTLYKLKRPALFAPARYIDAVVYRLEMLLGRIKSAS